jgi:hypothetical protein
VHLVRHLVLELDRVVEGAAALAHLVGLDDEDRALDPGDRVGELADNLGEGLADAEVVVVLEAGVVADVVVVLDDRRQSSPWSFAMRSCSSAVRLAASPSERFMLPLSSALR